MIRRPEDENWVPIDSRQARDIFEGLANRCNGRTEVFRCRPPSQKVE